MELKQKQILLRLFRKVDSSRYLGEMVLQVHLYDTDTCISQCIQFVYSRIVIWGLGEILGRYQCVNYLEDNNETW